MRLDFDDKGGWLVTAEELAQHLMIDVERLRRHAALGLISARLEYGSGLDKGRSRVTISAAGHAWQGIFDLDRLLLSEIRWQTKRNKATQLRKSSAKYVKVQILSI